MLVLVEAGEPSPSAEQVSRRAGVGLRSVFRHFKEMERLHEAMSDVLTARLTAIAEQPFAAASWRGQVLELVDRRANAFERMSPFLHAGRLHRHRSKILQANHAAFVAVLRRILVERLPAQTASCQPLIEAIDLLLSFEAWQRLRTDQKLSTVKAKAVLKHAVTAILDAQAAGGLGRTKRRRRAAVSAR